MKPCQICYRHFEVLHRHHIVRAAQGGSDEDFNRFEVCPYCHDLIHRGKLKIKASWLSQKTIDYIKKVKPQYKHIDWSE